MKSFSKIICLIYVIFEMFAIRILGKTDNLFVDDNEVGVECNGLYYSLIFKQLSNLLNDLLYHFNATQISIFS